MKKLTSLDEIQKIPGADEKFIKDFISSFIKQLALQLINYKESVEQNNIQEIKHIAHKMKSSLFYFGMHDQKIMAQNIEDLVTTDFEKAKQLISEIIIDCNLAIEELNGVLTKQN